MNCKNCGAERTFLYCEYCRDGEKPVIKKHEGSEDFKNLLVFFVFWVLSLTIFLEFGFFIGVK